jgi:outer membrane protein assembly complex protein YaeT
MDVVRALLRIGVCLAAVAAVAQVPSFEGREVVTIQFEPRRQPLDPGELYDILPLKTRRPLRMADVRASIERLYATGRYADIQVDAQPSGGGVMVRFLTRNSWFVGHVSITGKIPEPPNVGHLENATRLELGEPFAQEKVDRAVKGAQDLLSSNGFYRATITPVFSYDEIFQQVHIDFRISSGPRAHFAPPRLTGDPKMAPARIIMASSWRRWILNTWKPVTQLRTRQGLDGILRRYQKDHRLETKVRLEKLDYDDAAVRVTPVVRIDAGPKIAVRAVGAHFSQSKLERLLPIFEEHTVDHDLLVEGARNLRNFLQSEGYFDARVEFEQQAATGDRAAIDYRIQTGPRHRLVHVEITGHRYFSTAAIRERMFVEPRSFIQYRHGRYSETLLAEDEESIVNLYKSNGFQDAAVTHRIVDDYQAKVGEMAVFLDIHEGPQYFVGSLQVEGVERLDKPAILGALSSVAGQPFSESSVAVDRDIILAQYFYNGFPNATFEWSAKPAAEPNRVDLRFVVREGSQQFVRQVIASGLHTTRQRLVNRNLRLNPGDPLSPAALTETQRRLYDLGVFAHVDAAIQNPDGESTRKIVLYEMEEARRYSLAAGFGAEVARIGGCHTCLDAPAGQAGFSPRVSFDITRTNLWGLGHSLGLRTRASTLDKRGLLTYTAPHFLRDDRLNISFTALYDDSRDVRTFSARRLEGSVQVRQRVSRATTMLYRYSYRRVSVNQDTLKITPFLIPLFSQAVRVGMLSWSLVSDRRDDPVDPHRGIYTTVDLGLAEHIIGSQRNFLRFLGRNATYHPLGHGVVLARSTSFGDIYSFRFSGDPLQAIPLPERFFGGGNSSLRAFPENQAGPRDLSTGFPLGGTALLFNQTELRFPLLGENLGGVLFHDAGNVYSSVRNISFRVSQRDMHDFDYMVHAVGFGVRYRTPVGPVRVDLGYGLNPPGFVGFKGTRQDLLSAGVDPCTPPRPGAASRCTAQSVNRFQFFFSIGQTF